MPSYDYQKMIVLLSNRVSKGLRKEDYESVEELIFSPILKTLDCKLQSKLGGRLIKHYLKVGMINEAKRFLDELKSQGTSPSVNGISSLIRSLSRDGQQDRVLEIIEYLVSSDINVNSATWGAVISTLAKTNPKYAEAGLEFICKINLIPKLYGIVVNGYINASDYCSADRVLRLSRSHKIPLTSAMIELASKVYTNLNDPVTLFSIYSLAKANSTRLDTSSVNSLLYSFYKLSRFDLLESIVFDAQSQSVSFNSDTFSITATYLSNNTHKSTSALNRNINRLFHAYVSDKSITADIKTVTCFLKASFKTKDHDLTRCVLEHMVQRDVKPDVKFYNTMIKGYIDDGNVQKAMYVAEEMESCGVKPDLVTFNTFLNAVAQSIGRSVCEFILSVPKLLLMYLYLLCICFEFLQQNTSQTCTTSSGVLNLNDVVSILQNMKRQGLEPDSVTFNTLLNIYCRSGHFTQAWDTLLQGLKNRHTELKDLDSLSWHSDFQKILKTINTKTRSSLTTSSLSSPDTSSVHPTPKPNPNHSSSSLFKPTIHSYNTLLHTFASTGNLPRTRFIFDLLCLDQSVKPDIHSYNSLFKAIMVSQKKYSFTRSGHVRYRGACCGTVGTRSSLISRYINHTFKQAWSLWNHLVLSNPKHKTHPSLQPSKSSCKGLPQPSNFISTFPSTLVTLSAQAVPTPTPNSTTTYFLLSSLPPDINLLGNTLKSITTLQTTFSSPTPPPSLLSSLYSFSTPHVNDPSFQPPEKNLLQLPHYKLIIKLCIRIGQTLKKRHQTTSLSESHYQTQSENWQNLLHWSVNQGLNVIKNQEERVDTYNLVLRTNQLSPKPDETLELPNSNVNTHRQNDRDFNDFNEVGLRSQQEFLKWVVKKLVLAGLKQQVQRIQEMGSVNMKSKSCNS
ncbi:hypothetical protein BKA69DRAFT_1036333 [Paraphysoderma sedebokerense]|nr:hypothetical protein BKA69DRAFT_1036333 [Paraphysoderma sedebokerense]